MENEENRGLINKKASKDQWAGLGQFSFGSLPLFSLSHTLGDLEFSWSTLGWCAIFEFLEKEGRGREGKCNKASGSTTTSYFLAGTKLHVCFLH